MNKIIFTFRILKMYLIDVVMNKKIMVGMDAQVQWDEKDPYPEPLSYYLSFSNDPVELEYDDFGVRDDEVFYYLEGIKEAIRFIWRKHNDGWRMVDGRLLTANLEE